MNNFLKNMEEIHAHTKYLSDRGLIESGLSCKNYDIAQVCPYLKGKLDICDLGSDGSEILSNSVRLGVVGRKVGIDLSYPLSMTTNEGIEIFKGDLMQTPFDDNSFDLITCMSVIEHSVDLNKLAKEINRLLRVGGTVFISFDYWTPKPKTETMQLYNLSWSILNKEDVLHLVTEMSNNGIELTSEIDWATQDAVINKFYCAPCDVEYTFGILQFIKK